MSAIQGIEGVISQLQATAMSARAQESLPQPTISFAGQLHAALDRADGRLRDLADGDGRRRAALDHDVALLCGDAVDEHLPQRRPVRGRAENVREAQDRHGHRALALEDRDLLLHGLARLRNLPQLT